MQEIFTVGNLKYFSEQTGTQMIDGMKFTNTNLYSTNVL
jgi:hypothetical protein